MISSKSQNIFKKKVLINSWKNIAEILVEKLRG